MDLVEQGETVVITRHRNRQPVAVITPDQGY
jgi:antitoxin (DNA-binding transcriptional repressor) of toxin-antitoxin stability system